MDTDSSKTLELLAMTERVIEQYLKSIMKTGTFSDIIDMDGKGGERTQRLSNSTGISEVRLIRSMLRREIGLDTPKPVPSSNVPVRGGTGLLSLIQNNQLPLSQLNQLGTDDE